jgi:hypothetical protein
MRGCDGDDDPAPIRDPERGQTATKECVVKRRPETRRDLMSNVGWKMPGVDDSQRWRNRNDEDARRDDGVIAGE